jgi:hypothetical protein
MRPAVWRGTVSETDTAALGSKPDRGRFLLDAKMLDQHNPCLWQGRFAATLKVSALAGLVLILILSAGFGWFTVRFGPESARAHYRRALGFGRSCRYSPTPMTAGAASG